ncbi:MAG: hypothetical protein AAFZ09_09585, partial [Pseudomonadota bacterium]
MHRSRIGVIVIDCETADLGPATAFWAAALGVQGGGNPLELEDPAAGEDGEEVLEGAGTREG